MDTSQEDAEYTADDLVQYFEARLAEYPRPEYELGLQHVREWQSLRLRSDVTQSEFDDFLGRVEDTDSMGSAYAHLWCTVRNWGYSLDFTVPKAFPPYPAGYRDTATCRSNDGFGDQITIDSIYDVLDLDTDRSLVRIRNDQSKHRWYPVKHFALSVPPDRQYICKPDW